MAISLGAFGWDRGSATSLPRYASRGAGPFLLHYVGRRLVSHSLVLLSVFSAVFCAIGSQYAVKHLVDVLDNGAPSDGALSLAVIILLLLVAGDNLLWRLAGWIASYAFVAVGGDVRLDLFAHLAGHGSRYFSDQFPGALAGRVTTAATAAWTIENSITWTTVPPAVAVVTSIGLLATIQWKMTAVLVIAVSIMSWGIARLALRGSHLHQRFAHRAATVNGNLADILSNIGVVRAFGATKYEWQRLSRTIGEEIEAQRGSLRALERLRLFHALAVFGATAGILAWSVALWRTGRITTGDVVLATTLGFTVLHASRDFAMAAVDLTQQFAKLNEAVHVLGLPHEIVDAPDARPLINLGGSITFLNVCFSYPNGERVLQDFTLHIPSGQKVGLVGRSGTGKSTVLALTQRLYDPERGHVLIDEQDIGKVTQEALRQAIAVVHQDISLFHRSILENIRYGRPDATDAEVYRAAEAAHCLEFVNQLPQGFDTIVGERGTKLSGGQRQRLAIARALLRKAQIILLDEATSALDSELERAIQDALTHHMHGRTVIAVAHRLSTLNSFDRVVVLDRGGIVEDGPAADLVRRGGVYSKMYHSQHLNTKLQ